MEQAEGRKRGLEKPKASEILWWDFPPVWSLRHPFSVSAGASCVVCDVNCLGSNVPRTKGFIFTFIPVYICVCGVCWGGEGTHMPQCPCGGQVFTFHITKFYLFFKNFIYVLSVLWSYPLPTPLPSPQIPPNFMSSSFSNLLSPKLMLPKRTNPKTKPMELVWVGHRVLGLGTGLECAQYTQRHSIGENRLSLFQ